MPGTFVSHWIDWKTLAGRKPRQRARVKEVLETHPALLYYGDSWFSTPLYRNLALQSAEHVDGIGMIAGSPGATASELFTPKKVDDLIARLRWDPFDAMLISAGGNDALSKRLHAVFRNHPRTGTPLSPADAFAQLTRAGLFDKVRERYARVLTAIRKDRKLKQRSFRVVGHTYSRLVRIGEAGELTVGNIGLVAIIKDDVGPWLYGPMRGVLADAAAAKAFADLLLERGFRDGVLAPMKADFPELFSYADLLDVPGMDQPGEWYDEIHPDAGGFDRLATVLNAELRRVLPQVKRHAVH